MMRRSEVPYHCPYCDKNYKGPIGYHNLLQHVEKNHPERFPGFKRISRQKIERNSMNEIKKPAAQQQTPTTIQPVMMQTSSAPQQQIPIIEQVEAPPVELDEVPMPLRETPMVPVQQVIQPPFQQPQVQQPQFQPLQQVQQPPEPKEERPHLPPYLDQLPPHEWLQNFLEYYNCDPLFIKIQVDNVLLTKELPTTATLMNDLKQMKSGHTHLTMIQYIGNMYEHMVRAYLKKQEDIRYTPRTGIPLSESLSHRSGIPVYQNERMDPYTQPLRTPYVDDNRVARLEDELRRYREEKDRELQQKVAELTMKLDQSKTYQEDPRIRELQEEVKRMSEGSRLLQQQLDQQREQNMTRQIEDIKLLAMSNKGISNEQILQMVDQRVREERQTIDARHELEQLLEQKLSGRAGTTQADVDMKKAELELELGREKIKAESEKTEMIGRTISDVAGVFGEGLGRGLSSKPAGPQQQPPQEQMQQQTPPPKQQIRLCPYGCNTQLLIEPGMRYGECPGCDGKVIIDDYGTPHIYQETPPAKQPPVSKKQTQQPPGEPTTTQGTASVILDEPILTEQEQYPFQDQPPIIDYTVNPDKKKQKEKQEQKEQQ